MGCCLSTKKPPQFHQHSSKTNRAPPPVDEETVKEVLSETPNPKHFTKIQDQPRKSLHKIQNYNHEDLNISDEVSEICSNMSESISTPTCEEDVEGYRRRVSERSPAKLRNRQQISPIVRNSLVRGKQQSPGRVRSVPEINNRGSGFGSTSRQRPMSATREKSRSSSPANRTAVRSGGARNEIGRSPSKRKMDNSPGRVRSRLPEMTQKPVLSSGIERQESSWGPIDANDDESIDNPLVSLECFIFL